MSKYDVVIVGGLGHVGLPLGIVMADSGIRTCLYDIDLPKRETVRSGRMPFVEEGAQPALERVLEKGMLTVAEDVGSHALSCISDADCVVVTIGTPIDEYMNPKLGPLLKLAEDLAPRLQKGCHVMLRSTLFPGATRKFHDLLAAAGASVDVSFCPERIVQGLAVEELRKLPQIISGTSPAALEKAGDLFKRMGVETCGARVEEAELAKLFLNAWRYIGFAVANQFYEISEDLGVDYGNVYAAMTWKYPRGKNIPGPGFAAGPCLLKDTMQLAAACPNGFPLGHAARLVNEGLPDYLVRRLSKELGDLSGRKVGILGMSFKEGIDDVRDSLSFKLKKLLEFRGAVVSCSDEFSQHEGLIAKDAVVQDSEAIVVAVPHGPYRGLRMRDNCVVLDLWGVTTGGKGS